jgi:hypothetical protein
LIEIFEPRPMLQVQEFCWIGSLGDWWKFQRQDPEIDEEKIAKASPILFFPPIHKFRTHKLAIRWKIIHFNLMTCFLFFINFFSPCLMLKRPMEDPLFWREILNISTTTTSDEKSIQWWKNPRKWKFITMFP